MQLAQKNNQKEKINEDFWFLIPFGFSSEHALFNKHQIAEATLFMVRPSYIDPFNSSIRPNIDYQRDIAHFGICLALLRDV